ncbi:MAG: tripartite tricarboxylate transporter permease [Desulfobacterales bacterium]|jgi:TctA family transporter|nr:tripartite tricarboxylate transporter permease [Desulfobacterales bacterium]
MELLSNLALGFQTAVSPLNLLYCLVGALIGTLIGVLPGIGPVQTIAILLPTTFALPPVSALIMLAGIYYGAQYGGSTTSILVNVPGEASAVVTCIDGHQMARQGRAGAALSIAALGSFAAGTFATFVLAVLAVPLSEFAFKFGPAEYFSLMVFGLIGSVVLASGSMLKAVGMIVLGLLLGMIGTDVTSGAHRFTFGIPELADGIGFVSLAMGLFGICDIINSLEKRETRDILKGRLTGFWLSRSDIRASAPAVLRGTLCGSLLGILPGGGAILSSFTAYMLEKKSSRSPESFGQGNICGVAAPESANNAAAQTSFIPLLTLGIPPNVVLAMMAGAMMIHGIQPGPRVIASNPELFWGVIVSMWVGNLILVLLNLPLVGLWVRLLSVPFRLLYPAILLFCCIGLYSVNNNTFDIGLTALCGLLGYVFHKLECEPAPLILGFILGPMMEENLRRGMLLSRGDPAVFFTRPLSLAFLLMAAVLLILVALPSIRRSRESAFKEG